MLPLRFCFQQLHKKCKDAEPTMKKDVKLSMKYDKNRFEK